MPACHFGRVESVRQRGFNLHLTLPDAGRKLWLVATRKTVHSAKSTSSKGALVAAKYRARANTLTDAERQGHRSHAMSLIYGVPHALPDHARRG